MRIAYDAVILCVQARRLPFFQFGSICEQSRELSVVVAGICVLTPALMKQDYSVMFVAIPTRAISLWVELTLGKRAS